MDETSTPSTASEAPTLDRALRLVNIPGGRPDLDGLAYEAAQHADARQSPLMLRLQPEIYFQGEGTGIQRVNTNRYRAWPKVLWKGEFPSAAALIEFRIELDAFIQDYFLRHAGSVTSPDTPTEDAEG